MFFLNDRITN